MEIPVLVGLILAASPPILFAVLGETITEKAGVINLSLDGTLLLTAMIGFVVALETDSIAAGFLAGMAGGALIALVVAFVSLTLYQNQVAVGFVLTLLCRDLAYVLGGAYANIPGPQVEHLSVPWFSSLPVLGTMFFDHNLVVYGSLIVVFLVWFFLFKTRPGLELQGLGERPAAAYVRGIKVTAMRYLYTMIGGALVGLGGACFSLMVKPGWARPYGIEGTGWIVLAIVIFGGWHPLRAALGAIFFVALQTSVTLLQGLMPQVPTQLFSTLPFPIMILTLLLVTMGNAAWTKEVLSRLPQPLGQALNGILKFLVTSPPASLGTVFKRE